MRKMFWMAAVFIVVSILSASSGWATNDMFARTSSYFLMRCGFLTNTTTCAAAGCYWWDGTCNTLPAAAGDMDYCISLEEPIQLCVTTTNTRYILVDMGTYQKAVLI